MRILVCGGRDFSNRDLVFKTLYEIAPKFPPDEYGNTLPDCTIIHGGAKGADQLADEWAVVNWTKLEVFKADWKKHGKAAGAIRNRQMLEEGKPDIVVAFPGGKGTANMVKIAKQAGIKVLEVKEEL